MTNWKTTLAAFIAGALPIIQGTIDSWGAGVPIQWAKIGMGLAIMALGLFAKDFNVTGAGISAHAPTKPEQQRDAIAEVVASAGSAVALDRQIADTAEVVKECHEKWKRQKEQT